MKRRKQLWLLVLITVLWLAGLGLLVDTAVIAAEFSVPGFIALAIYARQVAKRRYDSAVPWACIALAPLAFAAAIALGNIHLHEFTGVGPGCDAMAQVCDPQPLQAAIHSCSLVLFIATGIAILRLITAARHVESV